MTELWIIIGWAVTAFLIAFALIHYAPASWRARQPMLLYVPFALALLGAGGTLLTHSLIDSPAVRRFLEQAPTLLPFLGIAVVGVAWLQYHNRPQQAVNEPMSAPSADVTPPTVPFTDTDDLGGALDQYRAALEARLQPDHLFIFLFNRETGEFETPDSDVRFTLNSPLLAEQSNGEVSYMPPGQPWRPAWLAERSRLRILNVTALAGFVGKNGLNGFAAITPRADGEAYDENALTQFGALTAQVGVIVERAQVVQSLERRVRELDVLGQVSQAVNFTVEYDDLLELISTQTDKLIRASHLYITLLEPGGDLYDAFYLEDDERYPEREGRRYGQGRDLVSEVIRTGQPLRVAEFHGAMLARGEESAIDPKLKAWMGVPLLVGPRTLGMMAVGTTQSGKAYNDDQLKMFGDIATLAATSIDKARLFQETNSRARQLAVLNDISQQLVASEANLEALLRLITASATDLLNAEAGSLLLMVDDGSSDLEFRVAIGGGGTGILGIRIPAHRGLVGEVASTGQAIIVNDAPNDPRWGGELGEARSGTFRTTNIIAVPLVTQNRVIGVLEVLNKRAGAFSPDDLDLLTTFAGQAAVAIDNARLFQLTDQQLSQRVSELETLERIDVELNRSLDLTKVARITVEWALENSSATAALLGLVITSEDGDAPHLEVVYQIGYGEDAPPDSDGRSWTLHRGIVSRIMRTKQPELVTDVTMDRDYVPSLSGGKSQITIPMLSGGAVIALLVLESNREPRLRLADMPFLQRLAEHAAIAIANAQLYAELDRANQSKSEFVSFVAHELKNPLTSIRGYSDFLLGGAMGAMSDQQRNFVGTIRSNAERMNSLVSDLNDVTKLQTNNLRIDPSRIQFAPIVEETVRPFQKQITDKEQQLVVDVPADLPPIAADSNRLIQVLTNLLSNAHKYSPEGSTITISATPMLDALDGRGRLLSPRLHIVVQDQGIGMSQEDLEKLFTAYFRSDNPQTREQPGTGLGLTITRGIVQRHGGDIWVESELGKGTAFHFTIPFAEQMQAEAGD